MPYGRTVFGTTGRPVEVCADGSPEWKAGGVTIDWSTVPAASADTTLGDDLVIKLGTKGIPYGTVLYKNTGTGLYQVAATGTTLVEGETFIVNTTILQVQPFGMAAVNTDNVGVLMGGRVWVARLQVGGSYSANLQNAAQPTLAAVLAAMPRLSPVEL